MIYIQVYSLSCLFISFIFTVIVYCTISVLWPLWHFLICGTNKVILIVIVHIVRASSVLWGNVDPSLQICWKSNLSSTIHWSITDQYIDLFDLNSQTIQVHIFNQAECDGDYIQPILPAECDYLNTSSFTTISDVSEQISGRQFEMWRVLSSSLLRTTNNRNELKTLKLSYCC